MTPINKTAHRIKEQADLLRTAAERLMEAYEILGRHDSRNAKGEATYAVPVDRFPPVPLPKP